MIEAIDRVNITYDIITDKSSEPLSTIQIGPGNKFMFGVRLTSLSQKDNSTSVINLNDQKRYFNINFRSSELKGGFPSSTPTISL